MKLMALVWLLCFCIGSVSSKDVFEARFENFTCSSDDPNGWMSEVKCGLSKSAKRRTLNMELEFKQDVKRFQMNLLILLPRPSNDFVLLNLTHAKGCDMISSKNQGALLQLSRATLERYSNLPNHCPLLKNRRYYIRAFRFNLEKVPAFQFESDVVIYFDTIVDKQKVVKGYIKIHVVLNKTKKKKRN